MGLALLIAAAISGGLYYLVVVNPGEEVEEEYIENILGRESPVYYRDGRTKLGVLFQDVHRQYLPFEALPKHFVNAIVAAEDDGFFSHYGVDIPGIVRAMIANIRAGRVVQGGSTITQQTAKNLFKRSSRSYRAKLKELLYALRLEYRYSKEKILEFYSNQFFVSGNGHGVGVAARYYFNKEPQQLTLLECAFIAGSVKRPNYYNPFTKRNQADPVAARKKVDERVGYVLQRMVQAGMLSEEEYAAAIHSDVAFERGKMTYRLNTSMDLVKDGLRTNVIQQALEEHGVSNVSTSGIRVVTTIDQNIQHQTLYALRQHLSRLDARLRGYARQEVQDEYSELEYGGDSELRQGAFVFGEITQILDDPQTGVQMTVDIGEGKATALVDEAGIAGLVAELARYSRNRWAQPEKKDRRNLLQQLQLGDMAYISIRESREGGMFAADLERFPRVEGAAMVLQQGAVRAMAGGMSDRYFNRAVDARRLMGSTLKPFVFAAALQLGWSTVDLLDNRRNVFVFMNTPYYPRPDHRSPHDWVSMSWAGVESENLAAVWLLYHLTDKLSPIQLGELADHLGMAPQAENGKVEPYQQYKQRIRDRLGIVVNRRVLEQAAFDKAKKALRADFFFDNRIAEYRRLEHMEYGGAFDRFAEEIQQQLSDGSLNTRARSELQLRQKILQRSFVRVEEIVRLFEAYRRYVENQAGSAEGIYGRTLPAQQSYPQGFLVQDAEGEVHFTLKRTDAFPEGWKRWPMDQVVSFVQSLNRQQQEGFWAGVQMEDLLSIRSYRQLKDQMQREAAQLFSQQPYSLDVLMEVRDFRVMLGLRYLLRLGQACGIRSQLEPVLSFPLGSNVITLLEATRLYETLVTGRLFSAGGKALEGNDEDLFDREGLAVIERIEAPDGEIIYEQSVVPERVFDGQTAAAISNILENTVLHGTGKFARDSVRLHSSDPEREQELAALNVSVPMLGKTGTANRYRNATFLGYVPVLEGNGNTMLSLQGGYAVGVYAGYDTNAPMVRGSNRISGAQGALPVWSKVADTLLQSERTGDRVDPIDLAFNGLVLRYPAQGQIFLPVDPEQGGKLRRGDGGLRQEVAPSWSSILSYGQFLGGDSHFEPERAFRPFWRNEAGDHSWQ